MRFVEDTGADGRPEYYATGDCWVVYCSPPGQSSGPRKVEWVKAGGFVGTASALNDLLGPFPTEDAARHAAVWDAEHN
jgi:hypothetical protein